MGQVTILNENLNEITWTTCQPSFANFVHFLKLKKFSFPDLLLVPVKQNNNHSFCQETRKEEKMTTIDDDEEKKQQN